MEKNKRTALYAKLAIIAEALKRITLPDDSSSSEYARKWSERMKLTQERCKIFRKLEKG